MSDTPARVGRACMLHSRSFSCCLITPEYVSWPFSSTQLQDDKFSKQDHKLRPLGRHASGGPCAS